MELNDCFSLMGECHDMPSAYAEADAFIMPSLHEGFGIAIIEAQSMSLKCFASTNIPLTTNCGNVTYLKLTDGPAKWGDAISQWYQKKKVKKRLATQKSLSVRMLLIKLENCIKLVRNENTCSW